MFKMYLKTAWRNIKKNKSFFALNFFGLYISLVACILIALIILHETSFDQSTNNEIKIYRVVSQNKSSTGNSFSGITQYPLASAMRVSMPNEKLISQIHFQSEDVVTFGNKKFKDQNIVFADSVFPKLFSLTLKEGSLQRALAEPGYAILTEKTANQFFGTEDAIGKRIKLANYIDLEVAAVVADAPSNSHLPYNMLVSYQSLTSRLLGGMPLNQWGVTSSGYTYIGLSDENRVKNIENILASIASTYIPKDRPDFTPGYKLQPLSDIHYNQLYAGSNISYTINYSYLYLMGVIGLFLILAACINYTNLSTALAIKKSKEVGVRKTMGATRPHLMKQFFSETFLFTAVVILAAALSIRPLLPHLNGFLDKNISLNWLNYKSGLFLLCLWAAVSLLSGLYPALILSGFNPITSLKTKMSAPKASVIIFRRGLVIFQFLTAQILIIGTIVVAKQMAFIQATPLGFSKQNVLDIDLPENKPAQLQAMRDQLSGITGISSFSLSLGAPISDNRVNSDFNLKEKYAAEKLSAAVKATDKGYLQTFGLQLVAGRWFDENDERQVAASIPDSLRHYSIVLSESAVKSLGFASPRDVLGKYVTFGINDISAPVIGVIKDFHVTSLHKAIAPVLMVDLPFFYYDAGIKLSGGYTASVLSAIEKAFTTTYPNALFQFGFLDEHIAKLYKEEKKTEQLFDIFAFLSIAINVLGLVGLLSFVIEQKTKEIGIRKVLGASVSSISLLLSKDFVRLIFISFLISAPIAWYIMNQWLQGFAYRTQISWWVFAATLAGALIITFMSIGAQTIRAAFTNPVKSLRSE
jgi:putative ABC transport system permease protein